MAVFLHVLGDHVLSPKKTLLKPSPAEGLPYILMNLGQVNVVHVDRQTSLTMNTTINKAVAQPGSLIPAALCLLPLRGKDTLPVSYHTFDGIPVGFSSVPKGPTDSDCSLGTFNGKRFDRDYLAVLNILHIGQC